MSFYLLSSYNSTSVFPSIFLSPLLCHVKTERSLGSDCTGVYTTIHVATKAEVTSRCASFNLANLSKDTKMWRHGLKCGLQTSPKDPKCIGWWLSS